MVMMVMVMVQIIVVAVVMTRATRTIIATNTSGTSMAMVAVGVLGVVWAEVQNAERAPLLLDQWYLYGEHSVAICLFKQKKKRSLR